MRRNQQLMQHRYFNYWDNAWALATGAVSCAVGGGVSGMLGNNIGGVLGAGFAGGATNSAMNGGKGWDILQGGLLEMGIAGTVYTGMWAYLNATAGNSGTMEIADSPYEKGDDNLAELQDARKMSSPEREMFKDFSEIMQTTEAKNAVEVAQSYKLGFRFKNLMGYAERMGSTHFFNSTTGNVLSPPPSGTNAAIHSHPNHAFPSNTDISSIAQFNNLHGYIYFQPKHNSQPQLYHYDSKYYYMIY